MSEPFDRKEERPSGGTALLEELPPTITKAEAKKTEPASRKHFAFEDEEETFFQRHRIAIIMGMLVVLAGAWLLLRKPSAPAQPVRKAPEPMVVRIQLPPPPPPPPAPKVPPPPPKDDKRVEAPSARPEPKPDAPKPKPAEKPPEGLGTNNKGPGPGMAGLGSSGDGMLGGAGGKGGGNGGNMAKWYSGQVGAKIAEALRKHPKTRSANLRVDAEVWVDGTGRVKSGKLKTSTGDSSLDATLTNEILPGIQLSEPPPPKLRMPIPLRFTARRPN